jgi:hypothetical protein
MREFIEAFVSECRNLPKRECDFRSATFGVWLRLLARFEQRGQAFDGKVVMRASERIQQARTNGCHWIDGVRLPSIIRTYAAQ